MSTAREKLLARVSKDGPICPRQFAELCAAHFVALFDLLVIAKENRADLVFFEVERDAGNLVRQVEQFAWV